MNKALLSVGFLLLGACSGSADTKAALEAMNLGTGQKGAVAYASRSSGGLGFLGGDRVTFKDVVLGAEAGEPGIRAATMTFSGLGMSPDGAPVFSALEFTDVKPVDIETGVDVNIALARLTSPNPAAAAYIAQLFNGSAPASGALFETWAFEKLTFNDLSLVAKPPQDSGEEGEIRFEVDELSVSDLKQMVAGSALLSGVKARFDIPASAGVNGSPINGSMSWDKVAVTGLRAEVLGAMAASGANPEGLMSGEFSARMMAAVTSPIDPGYDTLAATPLTLNAAGATLVVSELNTTVQRNTDGVAVKASTPRTTIALSADADGGILGQGLTMGLGVLGYQGIELYGSSEASFAPETDALNIASYEFGMTDGFNLAFKGDVTGARQMLAGLYAMTPTGEPNLGAFASLGIKNLELVLTDKSLTNRLLNLAPMLGAGDPEQVRAMAASAVVDALSSLGALGVDPGVSDELAGAVVAFVNKPGVLTIRLAPATPIDANSLSGAGPVTKEVLGFSAAYSPQ
ncbi:hypothetical protein GC169_10095 [bacterium]|nr:hypothetical protein [bacterium]